MTASNLIVFAPWAVFGAVLAIVCLRLRKTRRIARRASSPPKPGQSPRQPAADKAAEPASRSAGRNDDEASSLAGPPRPRLPC